MRRGRHDEARCHSKQNLKFCSTCLAQASLDLRLAHRGVSEGSRDADGAGSWSRAMCTRLPLAIGAPAPDFALPRDRRLRQCSLASFKDHKVARRDLHGGALPDGRESTRHASSRSSTDYTPKERGVRRHSSSNNAKALRLDEMGYTDLGDSLEEMKVRAEHRQFNFRSSTTARRRRSPPGTDRSPRRTCSCFDSERQLRYQGRVDSNPRETLAKVPDARQRDRRGAGGHARAVQTTPTVGCSIKWLEKEALHDAEMAKIEAEPIPLEKIGADGIRHLRQEHRPARPCS